MKRFISFGVILAAATVSAVAQTMVSGSVGNKAGEELAGCTVLFLQADTVTGGAVTDNKGKFELKGLPKGEYECQVSMVGYKPASQKFTLSDKTKLAKFILDEDAEMLGEVTVTGDARAATKELAGMSVYYLTERAKKEPNVYLALREIPRLRIIDRKITLDDGSSPLILVNGVKKPLDVLSPEFIESVEIIDNPSARYRDDASVVSVLNLKIKKEGVKPYLRGDIGGKSMLNANFIYSNASFEIGDATSSLYLTSGYMQARKMVSNGFSDIYQGDIHRVLNDQSKTYMRSPYLMFGGDKEFSKKNYAAFSLNYFHTSTGGDTDSNGEISDMATRESSHLTSFADSKSRHNELSANLYYKHTFNSKRILELTGDYYYSQSGNMTFREEKSELLAYTNKIDLDNSRHMGDLKANYSDMLTGSIHLDAGSNTEYSVTNIDDRLDSWPYFRYKMAREYLYAGIDNNRSTSRFNYMLSLGLDMVFSDADGERNSYIDFVPSASISYKPAKGNTLKLLYRRSRTVPNPSNLNPRNTSSDILQVNMGNPMLKPSHTDQFRFDYVLSNGIIRFNPYVVYSYNSDIVQGYGYLDGDVYVRTYRNFGHTQALRPGFSLSYNVPQGKPYYGNVSVGGYYLRRYIKGMSFPGRGTYNLILQGFAGYKRVSMNAYFEYGSGSYDLYSKVGKSIVSNFQFNWSVSNTVSVNVSAENFICGRLHSETWTVNGDYNSYVATTSKSLAPKICVGVFYTFMTKNFKWRNKKQLGNSDGALKSITTN